MRLSIRVAISLTATLGCFAAWSAAAIEPAKQSFQPGDSSWNPWLQLGLIGSNDLSRAEGELFLPNGNDTTIGFLDIRGNFFTEDFDDKEIEGNMALGLRHMLESGWNLGLWVGGDVREVESNNTFWQISTGVEALHDNWDFRFNGYAPVTDPKRARSSATSLKLSGSNIFITGGFEVPLFGYDGEVGARIPFDKLGLDRDKFEMRIYAGGFHYFDDDAKDSIAGPSTRLQGTVFDVIPGVPGSRLIAHAEFKWDDVRGEHYEGGLLLRIPLAWENAAATRPLSARSRQARRMLEPIVRDVDIVTTASGNEKVEDALTDVRFDRVAFATPGDDITTTSAAVGENSLIVANGDFDGAQKLEGDQTLQGGGSTIAVRGVDTGSLAYFTAPGSSASITHTDVGPVLDLLGTRTHVAGFSISGAGEKETLNNHGIFTDVPDFFGAFTYLTIEDTAANGIFLSGEDNTPGDTTGIFEHVTVVNTNSTGILIQGGSIGADGTRTGSFYDVSVSFTGSSGIVIGGGGNGDRIGMFENVTVSDTGGDGIELGGSGTGLRSGAFDGVTIRNTTGDGILYSATEGTAEGTFDDTTFEGTIGDGDDALIATDNAMTTFDGTVTNDATNSPDLCQGTFTGTIEFEGTDAATITDGVGCL